jgi:hypothetical protein
MRGWGLFMPDYSLSVAMHFVSPYRSSLHAVCQIKSSFVQAVLNCASHTNGPPATQRFGCTPGAAKQNWPASAYPAKASISRRALHGETAPPLPSRAQCTKSKQKAA